MPLLISCPAISRIHLVRPTSTGSTLAALRMCMYRVEERIGRLGETQRTGTSYRTALVAKTRPGPCQGVTSSPCLQIPEPTWPVVPKCDMVRQQERSAAVQLHMLVQTTSYQRI